VAVFTGGQREALGLAFSNIEDKLRVLPHLILAKIDIEGATSYLAKKDIIIANNEFTFFEAHWQAAVTTSARLIEQNALSILEQPLYRLKGRNRCNNSRFHGR
jgi:hypothetical protein